LSVVFDYRDPTQEKNIESLVFVLFGRMSNRFVQVTLMLVVQVVDARKPRDDFLHLLRLESYIIAANTQHDHVVAVSDQFAKDDVLLPHEIHLLQAFSLDRRENNDLLVSCLEDRCRPEITAVPNLQLSYRLALVDVSLSGIGGVYS
jgi:hypothetical protein